MPLHDLICLGCGERIENFFKFMDDPMPLCQRCGLMQMTTDWQRGMPNVQTFEKYEGVWEDIGSTPINITSRSQLREECHKRGLTSKLLEW